MIKYKHALALTPYFGDSTALMGVFPPTGLEYIIAIILRKARRMGFVSGSDLADVCLELPLLIYGLIRRKMRKRR